MNKTVRVFVSGLIIILLGILTTVIIGCASGGPGSPGGSSILRFTITVPDSGVIDTLGNGYYAVLLNNRAEMIEVTNYDTFTDFIRFDGANFTWYHRHGNVPTPGYTWVAVGNLNDTCFIGSEGRSLVMRFDLSDSAGLFNQFITATTFTTHVVTTDRESTLLGRVVDTLGPGPSISGNTLYTVVYNRTTGLVSPPPPLYPWDSLGDWLTKPDLPNFPYVNYDIESFQVEFE